MGSDPEIVGQGDHALALDPGFADRFEPGRRPLKQDLTM
jgi:hypothetical protein